MFIKDHGKSALIYGDSEISYSELIEHIKDYSSLLKKYRKKRLAIFFENRPEWVYAFFAAWNVGAVPVLIDAMSTKGDVEYILKDSGASAVITSDQNKKLLAQAVKASKSKAEVINVDGLRLPKKRSAVKEHVPDDDEIVLLLYTSGTSGDSKGVMLTWRNIHTNIRWNNDTGRIHSGDRMIAILPNHHSWPLISTILCPLDCGATTVFLPALDAETLVRTIRENHITMVTAVPRLFELLHEGIMKKIRANIPARLLMAFCKFLYILPFNKVFGRVKETRQTLDIIPLCRVIFKKLHDEFGGNIKTFISGGAKLDEGIIRDFRALGILMLEGYGLTESSPMVTYHPFDAITPGSVGRVFDEIDIRFEEDGEVLVKGPTITPGYWNKPDDTAAAFTSDGYFHTGDLGRIDKNGFLFLTGRKKDLIILSNGKNVRPDLIEAKIKNSSNLIQDIAVAHHGNSLVALVVPDTAEARRQKISNITESIKFDVIDEYNKNVENYKKIHELIISTDDLPRTRMGKLKRYQLEGYIAAQGRRKKSKASGPKPSYEEYRIIEKYITKQAGVAVLPEDHIELDLGLDSLEIVELRLFIEKSFGLKISEEDMAHYAIVKDLAEHVKEKKNTISASTFDIRDILTGRNDMKLPMRKWMMDVMNLYFIVFYKRLLKLRGKGSERIPDGPCIIAPNHASYLDGIVVYHFLKKKHKKDVYFVAKEKNFRNPLFRFFASNSRVIVMDINRNLHESLQKIAEILHRGKKVMIFPEGTRTRTGNMQRFKNTFASISKALNVPVIPVAIKGAFESMPYTSRLPKKGQVSVEFLDRVNPDNLSEEEIVRVTFQAISERLAMGKS